MKKLTPFLKNFPLLCTASFLLIFSTLKWKIYDFSCLEIASLVTPSLLSRNIFPQKPNPFLKKICRSIRMSFLYACPFSSGVASLRRHKLHIVCLRVNTKAHSFRCSSSPQKSLMTFREPHGHRKVISHSDGHSIFKVLWRSFFCLTPSLVPNWVVNCTVGFPKNYFLQSIKNAEKLYK